MADPMPKTWVARKERALTGSTGGIVGTMADRMTRARGSRRGQKIDVYLSDADTEKIAREAARRGISVSAYLRMAGLGQAELANDVLRRLTQAADRLTQATDVLDHAIVVRGEALAETLGEVAIAIVNSVGTEPLTEAGQQEWIDSTLATFTKALRERLGRTPV